MLPGDIAEIEGKTFPFRGEVDNATDASTMPIGVYRFRGTNDYFLHHSKSNDPDIIEAYKRNMLDDIANDTSIIQRERTQKEIFRSDITQEDSYLKVVLKKILDEMQIDIRDYKHKFQNDNHLNNMRRLVTSNAGLTMDKFCEWCDILGYSWKLTIYRPDGSVMNV